MQTTPEFNITELSVRDFKKLLTDISSERGCYFSRITGSGSVCYGLFDSVSSAKKALSQIKIKHPKFWFSIAKTV